MDHIPKHIVLKAISDMNLRSKWDTSLGDIEVIEQQKESTGDQTVARLRMKTPHHMQSREAVFVRKVLKDFPEVHSSTVVQRSTMHPRCQENLRTTVRVDMIMNGFIIQDDQSLKGTKVSWYLSHDLCGSLPNSMLYHIHVRHQVQFIQDLVKACHQIVKGQLK